MGRSVNKVQIIGTLGRDPEMKYLPSGSAVVTVSVATDESYNDKNSGQKVEKTEWHRLTAFGKLAEIIGQYLKKGSRAYFEGKLRTNEYEKDGIKRYSTEIVVNDMMMLDSRQDAGVNQGFANTAPMANNPSAAMGQQQGYAQPPQQAAQGYNQGQQPAQQPPQGGFAPQQPTQRSAPQPQQGGFAPQPQPASFAPQQPAQQGQQPQQAPQAAPQPANNFDSFDDDIPF
jgi:single-strand DNA-binding protein